MPAAVVKDGTVTPKFRQGKFSPPFLTAKFSPRNSPLAKFFPPLYRSRVLWPFDRPESVGCWRVTDGGWQAIRAVPQGGPGCHEGGENGDRPQGPP